VKVDSLGGASGDLNHVNQRAKDIKKEAEDLFGKATKGIDQLKSEYRSGAQYLRLACRGTPTYGTGPSEHREICYEELHRGHDVSGEEEEFFKEPITVSHRTLKKGSLRHHLWYLTEPFKPGFFREPFP